MLDDSYILDLTDNTFHMMRRVAEHSTAGVFIYHADGNEEFIFVNKATLDLTGCDTEEQFAIMTGNSFRGLVHSDDISRVETEIAEDSPTLNSEKVIKYRINCRDGSKKTIRDYGYILHTEKYGDVYYRFIEEDRPAYTVENADNLHRTCQEANIPSSMCKKNIVQNESSKKTILVVEDSEINQEILSELLKDEFRILIASNGEEGIKLLKENRNRLALILLDVYMPICNGFEFLEETQKDPFLSSVPVIVTTGSEKHEDEEKCLRLGAADFITKPYNLETMLGRIHNVIRLHETISELSVVEYDKLTGLYTMPAFLHHAAQLFNDNDSEFDLGILSILDFSTINRIYGENIGDEVLKYFGTVLKDNLPNVLLARSANNFLALHTSDQNETNELIKPFLKDIEANAPITNIRTRMGMYKNVDKEQPVSIICDRAKLAVSQSDNGAEDIIYYYDESMEQKQLEEKKIITDFDAAIQNHEFVIWIQPKVNIADKTIVGGEALVRWIDNEGNFRSPGAFIPLYEREGQIQVLDEYIFRTVCVYQHKRREEGKRMIPISVNLSRNSLFSRGIVERYLQIAREEEADLELVPLEITESAATSEKQIKDICECFVKAGFVLQMDDFGTGYSSISALATLPFAVLKLDKSLIDQIDTSKGNIVIKNLIDTAHELGMKVVAEGVEEKHQAEFLAMVDCDQIQGYYFSPPKKTALFDELMDTERPFSGDDMIDAYRSDGIVRLGSGELSRYIRVCKSIFSAVRLLETDCCGYCMANRDGSLGENQSPCYAIWDRNERCKNCTSLKAMQMRKTTHKFEMFNNEVYSIYSVYIEVDGAPRILELVGSVGSGMLHGYKEDTSLLELMLANQLDLFMDVQLGTLNRRFFEECRERLNSISALAMIDVDNFKEINDRFGHLAGDSVLAECAHAIKSVIRDNDFFIRMGGDELMIGFTGMKHERLKVKAEDIRMAVENIQIPGNENIHPTVSIGATSCDGYSEEARETADRALYEAKQKKNMSVVR